MKTWHKALGGLLLVILVIGVIGYLNRTALMLAYISYNLDVEVAENRPVDWQEGPASADIPLEDRPPNIVFILVDDLGINDLSTFGGGVAGGTVPTPNIDRLAAEGALFSQAYAGSATCAPSRAMLMTGRYPTRTGFEFTPLVPGMSRAVGMVRRDIRDDLPDGVFDGEVQAANPPFAEQGLPTSEMTIAEALKGQGYHTVHIGKWHLGRGEGFSANDQGFDESLLMESGLFLPEDDPNVVNAKVEFDPIDHFLWAGMKYSTSYNGGKVFKPGGYLTDYWTDEAVRVIEANKNRPFFLYLAHWGVHTPLQATRADYEAVGDIKPHRLRVYAAMLRALDRSVGRVMEKLEREGLSDNTVIVFSSDNGGAGYIGLPDVNAPYRGWKLSFFEGGIRVSLFIKWPGRVPAGSVYDTPVAHVDVMPTLASAGGAPLPEDVIIDGVDLLPLATGSGAISRPNDAIYWQSADYQVVRAGDWKLQTGGRGERVWLYNLATDPTEQTNLATQEPEKLAELQALLAAHRADRTPTLYRSSTQSPVMIDKTLAERFEEGDEHIFWSN